MPENHLGPRNYFKSDYYKSSLPFCERDRYHGCPSVKRSRNLYHPNICGHTIIKNGLCMLLLQSLRRTVLTNTDEFMARRSGSFSICSDNLGDFVKASQISQAEALSSLLNILEVENRTTGIIWWNLMDGNVFSDAIVDYF